MFHIVTHYCMRPDADGPHLRRVYVLGGISRSIRGWTPRSCLSSLLFNVGLLLERFNVEWSAPAPADGLCEAVSRSLNHHSINRNLESFGLAVGHPSEKEADKLYWRGSATGTTSLLRTYLPTTPQVAEFLISKRRYIIVISIYPVRLLSLLAVYPVMLAISSAG
ncbi:hypothetical protein C8R45DRAFT_937094 [Mycena sanguinolenta]|nr:hypothetical protein C8R45DRAFT_937094 [Mycena sanguinolenta]